jgi:hypothetical protein
MALPELYCRLFLTALLVAHFETPPACLPVPGSFFATLHNPKANALFALPDEKDFLLSFFERPADGLLDLLSHEGIATGTADGQS